MNENQVNNNENSVVTPVEPVVSGNAPVVDSTSLTGVAEGPAMSSTVGAGTNEESYMALRAMYEELRDAATGLVSHIRTNTFAN